MVSLSSVAMLATACVLAAVVVSSGVHASVSCPVYATPITPQVQFDISDTSKGLQVKTSSCPNYNYTLQSTGNPVTKTCRQANYPFPPVMNSYANRVLAGVYTSLAQTTKNSLVIGGPIGHSVNGIAMYANSDMLNRIAYETEGKTFDQCAGHASGDGLYHYHSEPPTGCVYTDVNGTHSPLYAIMADGFPLYGRFGDNGVLPTDLDECNGHSDASHPFYHYHLPPVSNTYPFTINCFRGCLPTNAKGYIACSADTTTYGQDYTVLKAEMAAVSVTSYECSGDGNSGGGPPGPPGSGGNAASPAHGSALAAAAAALVVAMLLRA